MAGAFTNPPGKLLLRVVWLRCWKNGDTHESFLIHQCLLSFVHLLAHFSFFNFILSCQLCRLWPTKQWNELNRDV